MLFNNFVCFVVHYDTLLDAFATINIVNEDISMLPGGTHKGNETYIECINRTSKEQGWEFFEIENIPFKHATSEDKDTMYYYFRSIGEFRILAEYKNKYDIIPTFVKKKLLETNEFINEFFG